MAKWDNPDVSAQSWLNDQSDEFLANNQNLIKTLKSEESDTSEQHLQWYFIGQVGWIWVAWHVIGIPASEWTESDLKHMPGSSVAADGSAIWPTVFFFHTKEKALDFVNNKDFARLYDKTDIVDLTK